GITGALLLVLSNYPLPFDQILNVVSTGNPAYDTAIVEALVGAWSSATPIITIHAATAIVIGILFFFAFIALTIKRKLALRRA
ncbi:MAG: hypothetical protein IKD07_02860, partial [Clostridia bacterium]|nr:hypothetical protein [Clostridia bacterium]